ASYKWSTGAETASIDVSTPGEYWVIVTDTENGCSDELLVNVTQDINPVTANITGGDQILTCSTTSITLDASSSTANSPVTYLWSNGETTASIDVTAAGTYSVTVT